MKLPNSYLCDDKLTILNKEIDLIQSVITRMAQNSFYVKGWCITLVAAIFSLSDGSAREHVYLPLSAMVLAFWWLDSYYLRLERLYRKLYACVIKRRAKKDYWLYLFDLNIKRWNNVVQSVPRIMFSRSEWPLYLILILILLAFGWKDARWVCDRCVVNPANRVIRHVGLRVRKLSEKNDERQHAPALASSESMLNRPSSLPSSQADTPPLLPEASRTTKGRLLRRK